MNQEELEARLAAIAPGGNTGRLRYSPTVTRKRVKNPAAAENGGKDPDAPVEIEVVVQGWENPDTGARVEAYIAPDGGYVLEKDIPGTKTPDSTRSTAAAADPNTPAGRKAIEDERESQWNRDTPKDPNNPAAGGSGLYETHTARREREAREAKDKEASEQRAAAEGRAQSAEGRAQAAEARAAAQANRPDIKIQDDGRGGTVAIITHPDGRIETKPVEGVAGKPDRVTVEGRIYERQPDGAFKDVTPQKPGLPPNAPRYTFDWNKPGYGLYEYATAVDNDPRLTDDQRKQLKADAHAAATSSVSQANAALGIQQQQQTADLTQRAQDASMANQRLSSGMSAFGNALTASQAATKYATGPDASAVLPYYLALSAATGQAFGGFNTPPRVQSGPALRQGAGMTIPGMPAPGMMPPSRGPSGAPPLTPAQTAAGLPGSPSKPAPLLPPRPMVSAADASAAVQAANAGQQGGPVSLGSALAGGAASWGGSTPPAQTPPAPTGPTGLGAMAVQQSMTGYDPRGVNQSLIAAGFDPDVVAMLGGTVPS